MVENKLNLLYHKPVAQTETIVPSSCSCTVHLTWGNVTRPMTPGIPGGFWIFDTSRGKWIIIYKNNLGNNCQVIISILNILYDFSDASTED